MNNPVVSVIIPYFNEKNLINDCIESLFKQTYSSMEVIVVDDGSNENTELKFRYTNNKLHIHFLKQKHSGPAIARNYAASKAKGKILVFADADMTFERDYIEKLIEPILAGVANGTFTRSETVSNWSNFWARAWNYDQDLGTNRRISESFPNHAPVFRALLRSEFDRVGGFDDIGFTDDWTLSRKLGYLAVASDYARCCHHNPDSMKNVYQQARWIGKNEFISGTMVRRALNLMRFSPLLQFVLGVIKAVKFKELGMPLFSVVYSTAVMISILKSFTGEKKFK